MRHPGAAQRVLFLACTAVLVTAPWRDPAVVVRAVAGVVVVGTVALGLRGTRAARGPWWACTAALVLWVLGDVLFDAHAAGRLTGVPSRTADGLWLAGYPFLAYGVFRLVRTRSGPEAWAGLLDGLVLGAALVVVLWVTLVAPTAGDPTGTDLVFDAVYVLADGLLVAGAAWLVLTPGAPSGSSRLLVAGTLVVFGADLFWAIADRLGHDWSVWLNPCYVWGYALVAAAALHPSAVDLERPADARGERMHPARLAFLGGSLFIGPFTAVIPADQPWLGKLVVSACSLGIVAVVVGRFVMLVRRTEHQQMELARNEARFRTITRSVPVGLYEVDDDLRITYSNRQAEELFGRAIVGRRAPELLRSVHPEDRRTIVAASQQVLRGEPARAELRIRRPDGTVRWVRWRGVPATNPEGTVTAPDASGGGSTVFASTEDITDLKALEAELGRLATHDAVTGLPNRRLLFEELIRALGELADRRRSLAVMFCDLDRFKLVNDMLGHDAGDALLRAIADRLRATLRAGDVAARYGGDEFVLMLRNPGSKLDVAALAQRVVECVQEPVLLGEHPVSVRASIGIAIAHGPGDDPDALLRNADVAMYRAKAAGQGRYAFFGSGVHPSQGPWE